MRSPLGFLSLHSIWDHIKTNSRADNRAGPGRTTCVTWAHKRLWQTDILYCHFLLWRAVPCVFQWETRGINLSADRVCSAFTFMKRRWINPMCQTRCLPLTVDTRLLRLIQLQLTTTKVGLRRLCFTPSSFFQNWNFFSSSTIALSLNSSSSFLQRQTKECYLESPSRSTSTTSSCSAVLYSIDATRVSLSFSREEKEKKRR